MASTERERKLTLSLESTFQNILLFHKMILLTLRDWKLKKTLTLHCCHPTLRCAAYMRQWIGLAFGSDNGLWPFRRQAIILIDAGLLSIGSLGTNFNELLKKIQNFSLTKMNMKISSARWLPFCLGGNELKYSVETGGRWCVSTWMSYFGDAS